MAKFSQWTAFQRFAKRSLRMAKQVNDQFLPKKTSPSVSVEAMEKDLPQFLQGWQLAIEHQHLQKYAEFVIGFAGIAPNVLEVLLPGTVRVPLLKESLSCAKRLGNSEWEWQFESYLGAAYVGLGQFELAVKHFNKQLNIAEQTQDLRAKSSALINLTSSYLELEQIDKALTLATQSLDLAISTDSLYSEAQANGVLGNIHMKLGNAKAAIQYHEKHLKIMQNLENKIGESAAFSALGLIHVAMGDVDHGIAFHLEHLSIAKQFHSNLRMAEALGNLGLAYKKKQEFEKALTTFHKSLQIFQTMNNLRGQNSVATYINETKKQIEEKRVGIII